VTDQVRLGELKTKLGEETDRFLSSDDPALLDQIAVTVFELAAQIGVSPEQLEGLRAAKASERGTFTERIVWHGNTPA
jgi:predicted house-cleaning noncanonical NTP pyrophosphatase (MazG superfamily)